MSDTQEDVSPVKQSDESVTSDSTGVDPTSNKEKQWDGESAEVEGGPDEKVQAINDGDVVVESDEINAENDKENESKSQDELDSSAGTKIQPKLTRKQVLPALPPTNVQLKKVVKVEKAQVNEGNDEEPDIEKVFGKRLRSVSDSRKIAVEEEAIQPAKQPNVRPKRRSLVDGIMNFVGTIVGSLGANNRKSKESKEKPGESEDDEKVSVSKKVDFYSKKDGYSSEKNAAQAAL